MSRIIRTFLALQLALACAVRAADLKARPWPLSDRSYAAIDPASVRVDSYLSEAVWLRQVGERNGSLAEHMTLQPVATIEVSRLDPDEEIDSIAPLVEKARTCAARLGANAVYLDAPLLRDDHLDGIRFTAYRAEYKRYLVSPIYLVALTQMTIPAAFLEEQLQGWENSHFGRVEVTFGMQEDRDTSLDRLARIKAGTAVRVLLRDGTDVKGTVSGLDEDQRLWIHPPGWSGFFRDQAVPASDIRSVASLL